MPSRVPWLSEEVQFNGSLPSNPIAVPVRHLPDRHLSTHRLRDNLGIIDNPKEAGELAEQVDDTGGVYFVTGFGGLFAPYWDMRAT